jgi:predicted DNA-binding transcriptional regulator AlpA
VIPTTGNAGLDALADSIADRVIARMAEREAPQYIGAREVARRLGLSPRTVHQRAKDKLLPSVRQGGRVMFSWPEVERAVNDSRR